MYTCNICSKILSTKFNLKVHQERHHKPTDMGIGQNQAAAAAAAAAPESAAAAANGSAAATTSEVVAYFPTPMLPEPTLRLSTKPLTFAHPFTCTISGASKCGKTALTKKILESSLIQPPPQRVLFIYKRWQPLYTEMKLKMPHIQFIQGIPLNIDSDDFLDPKVKNLIVLDDQMSDLPNNRNVSELFTEGSHHRNLSILNLTQNLFPPGRQSTTQRRNTQYMVLFKSPMAQDQVRVLGRFMFPGKLQQFMRVFDMATQQPYGYLAIDATQATPDGDRLKTNIFEIKHQQQVSTTLPETPINKENFELKRHLSSGSQRNNMSEIMAFACDDCGTMFDTVHDLQRHVKSSCPEGPPATKKAKLEIQDAIEGPKEHKTEYELPVFKSMFEDAEADYEDAWRQKVKKYMRQDYSRKEAEEAADDKLKPLYMSDLLKSYISLINKITALSKGVIHNEVMSEYHSLAAEGYTDKEAIYIAVKRHENHIESLLFTDDDNESSASEDSDQSDVESETGDSETDNEADDDDGEDSDNGDEDSDDGDE